MAVFTLCGGVLSILGPRALSTLFRGLSDWIACNCLMIAICFILCMAEGGVNFLCCSNNSVAATTVLSRSEIIGSFQLVGLRYRVACNV